MNAAALIDFPMPAGAPLRQHGLDEMPAMDLRSIASDFPLARRRTARRHYLFRAGQPMTSLFLVCAGFLKISILSEDGREKITGFRMRGDLLGMESLGSEGYLCDAVALDLSEVWELPVRQIDSLNERIPGLREQITAALALEIRRDWRWMLTLGTLNAEQRVVAFLLDMASRQHALGFSASQLTLHMTRADVGNFLALQLETVTRALSHLDALGVIEVQRREIRLLDPAALKALVRGSAPRQ